MARVGLDPEDPLQLFSKTPPSHDALIGEWMNEHLSVKIFVNGKGKLAMASGKKELVLTEVKRNTWSVADAQKADVEVYVAQLSESSRAELTLQPPEHTGSSKKAVLRRVETSTALAPESRDQSRSSPRRHRGRRGKGDRRSRSRSTGRSRSRPQRKRSPSRRRVNQKDDGEEITTLFITGLPDDVREEDIMDDLEDAGTIMKVVMMRRGSERNCFVRFASFDEAQDALDRIGDGKLKVCRKRVNAELARRNSN